MVRIGFSRLILLGLLLKITLFMGCSSAQPPQFQGGDYNVELHNHKKELALASTKSKMVVIGGRKMIEDRHEASCEETETESSKEGNDPALFQEPRGEANDPCNHQKTNKILGPKDQVFSGRTGISRSDVDEQGHNIRSTKIEGYPPDSEAKPADDRNQAVADESSQRHLEAANDENEILNLMHKDYRGFPKPRRKPPINNHEPEH